MEERTLDRVSRKPRSRQDSDGTQEQFKEEKLCTKTSLFLRKRIWKRNKIWYFVINLLPTFSTWQAFQYCYDKAKSRIQKFLTRRDRGRITPPRGFSEISPKPCGGAPNFIAVTKMWSASFSTNSLVDQSHQWVPTGGYWDGARTFLHLDLEGRQRFLTLPFEGARPMYVTL